MISKKKNHLKNIGTITCVIGVTCVISSLGSPNGPLLMFSETSEICVTSVISLNVYLVFLAYFWCNMCNLCDQQNLSKQKNFSLT